MGVSRSLLEEALKTARAACAAGASLAVAMSRASFGTDQPPNGNASRDTLGWSLNNALASGVYGLLWDSGRIPDEPPGWGYQHLVRTVSGPAAVEILDAAA